MASKYRTGMVFATEDRSKSIEILSVVGSCHGNTSRIMASYVGDFPGGGGETQRPVRTSSLTEAIKNWGMQRVR